MSYVWISPSYADWLGVTPGQSLRHPVVGVTGPEPNAGMG